MNKGDLRQQKRRQRRALSSTVHAEKSANIAKRAVELDCFLAAHCVGLYLPFDGEVGTEDLIQQCWQNQKRCYLPVVAQASSEMYFASYTTNSHLEKNRYGIDEPVVSEYDLLSVEELDLVFVPLVAFDKTAGRLGMGGGYYDRALAQLMERKPTLVGLAFAFQNVTVVPMERHDICLDMVLTELQCYP